MPIVRPLCAICEHPVPPKCDVCNVCREKYASELGASPMAEWAQFMIREERARRHPTGFVEIAFSDLCYCDRVKVEAAIGEQQDAD